MRYYSTQRPIAPGAYPVRADILEIVNFDEKKFCEEIGREAWGYLDMVGNLLESEEESYELTKAGEKMWLCVTSTFDDKGRVTAAITDSTQAAAAPRDNYVSTWRKDIYINWYGSYEEALAAVEEVKMA